MAKQEKPIEFEIAVKSSQGDPLRFKIGTRTFEAQRGCPIHVFKALMDGEGSTDSICTYIDAVLVDDDNRARFAEALVDPVEPLDIQALGDLVEALMERHITRPKDEPALSSIGPPTTGDGSTESTAAAG